MQLLLLPDGEAGVLAGDCGGSDEVAAQACDEQVPGVPNGHGAKVGGRQLANQPDQGMPQEGV